MIREDLIQLCSGHVPAVELIEGFWQFMEAWDDMVDRDKPVDDETMNGAILWALFGLQDNSFYRTYAAVLRGAMQQAVVNWLTANKFERTKVRELVEQAYFLRCAPYDFFATVVLLASGPDKHMQAVDRFRRLAPEDTLASYMREHMGDDHGMVG